MEMNAGDLRTFANEEEARTADPRQKRHLTPSLALVLLKSNRGSDRVEASCSGKYDDRK